MTKKFLLLFLGFCLIYTTVYAENTLTINSNYQTATETIDIDVSLSNNPGIAAFDFTLNFDNNVLYPISIKNGIVDNVISNIQSDNISDVNFVSAVMAQPNNFNENGVLFTIRFKIKDKKADSIVIDVSGIMCNQKQENIEIENIKQVIKINQNNRYSIPSGSISSSIESDIKGIDNVIQDVNQSSIIDNQQETIVKFDDISDVPWANEAIVSLYLNGIIEGTSETTFSPNDNITRADFIILLMRKLGFTSNFSENFDDVSTDMYYYQAIGIAKALGIATGTGANQFKPNDSISRQDMFVLTYRALKKSQRITDIGVEILEQFKDKNQISKYAENALATLTNSKYIEGSEGYIHPKESATRAETAVFLYRLP